MNNQKQPTLVVLVGLPGTGKSGYVSRMMSDPASLSTVVLGIDSYLEARRLENPELSYKEVFALHKDAAERELNLQKVLALTAKADIIWDQTNLSRQKREMILAQIPEDYRKVAVVFHPPMDQVLAVNEARVEYKRDIDLHVLEAMATLYEPPTLKEGFDEVYDASIGGSLMFNKPPEMSEDGTETLSPGISIYD